MTIQKLLRSFSEMLSEPLETVREARAVYEFITKDPLIGQIEGSSLIEPKVEIESVLEPILAKITGVVEEDGSTASDDTSSEGDGASSDSAEGSRAEEADASGGGPAGEGEVSQEIQEAWGKATGEIVGRLEAMSKHLDAMSPPLATKVTIQKLLRSFSEMLSEPLETVREARAVYEFITTDPLIGQIEGSSLVEPKVEIESVLEPILAKIAGVAAEDGSPADGVEAGAGASGASP